MAERRDISIEKEKDLEKEKAIVKVKAEDLQKRLDQLNHKSETATLANIEELQKELDEIRRLAEISFVERTMGLLHGHLKKLYTRE